MHINVFSIEKSSNKTVDTMCEEYMKMTTRYADLSDHVLFNKDIAQAQNRGENAAKAAYTKIYTPHLKGYNIALDVEGKGIDSYQFSEIFDFASQINFFIGGAYGFEQSFLNKVDKVISLGTLTFAHKIAKVVLFEQIYRGLCIRHNHPYHKS